MRILIVDDLPEVRRQMVSELAALGAEILECADGQEALELCQQTAVDVVVSDVRMPRLDGIGLLRALPRPAPPVILHSGYQDVARAVEGLRLGAADFLPAPIDHERLRARVDYYLRRDDISAAVPLIGESSELERIRRQVQRMADAMDPVLITGETGVGKEVVARAIHAASQRRKGPFVAVNVCALSENLLASELFGHERGAFTGAAGRHAGRFEQADGGTLLLDEIGDAPAQLQAALLRVVDTGTFERVGGSAPIRANVRIVAATHRDLPYEVAQRRFREDLWFRLSALRIHVPPLRERRKDVDVLARRELETVSLERGGFPFEVDADGYRRLRAHNWPGNVRELRLTIRRMSILAGERRMLDARDVEEAIELSRTALDPRAEFDERERESVLRALEAEAWNVSAAARRLDLSRGAMRHRMRRFGLGD
jgi:DNA-binding NtrC family response regulator